MKIKVMSFIVFWVLNSYNAIKFQLGFDINQNIKLQKKNKQQFESTKKNFYSYFNSSYIK